MRGLHSGCAAASPSHRCAPSPFSKSGAPWKHGLRGPRRERRTRAVAMPRRACACVAACVAALAAAAETPERFRATRVRAAFVRLRAATKRRGAFLFCARRGARAFLNISAKTFGGVSSRRIFRTRTRAGRPLGESTAKLRRPHAGLRVARLRVAQRRREAPGRGRRGRASRAADARRGARAVPLPRAARVLREEALAKCDAAKMIPRGRTAAVVEVARPRRGGPPPRGYIRVLAKREVRRRAGGPKSLRGPGVDRRRAGAGRRRAESRGRRLVGSRVPSSLRRGARDTTRRRQVDRGGAELPRRTQTDLAVGLSERFAAARLHARDVYRLRPRVRRRRGVARPVGTRGARRRDVEFRRGRVFFRRGGVAAPSETDVLRGGRVPAFPTARPRRPRNAPSTDFGGRLERTRRAPRADPSETPRHRRGFPPKPDSFSGAASSCGARRRSSRWEIRRTTGRRFCYDGSGAATSASSCRRESNCIETSRSKGGTLPGTAP